MPVKTPVAAYWPIAKQKLQESYMILSEDDLTLIPGREEELYDRLSRRLRLDTENIRRMIESFGD